MNKFHRGSKRFSFRSEFKYIFSSKQVLKGNKDSNKTRRHDLPVPAVTSKLIMEPITWHNNIGLRMEIYGCEPSNFRIFMHNWLASWLNATNWLDWYSSLLFYLYGCLLSWLADWLTDWLTDWLNDRLNDWRIDGLTDWRIDGLTDWRIDELTDWRIDGLTHWLIDWLTDWLIYWLFDWLPGDSSVE